MHSLSVPWVRVLLAVDEEKIKHCLSKEMWGGHNRSMEHSDIHMPEKLLEPASF